MEIKLLSKSLTSAKNELDEIYEELLWMSWISKYYTAWKASVFGVILVRISPHSDWIRKDTPYLSVFSPNAGKHGAASLRIQTLFTQCYIYVCSKCFVALIWGTNTSVLPYYMKLTNRFIKEAEENQHKENQRQSWERKFIVVAEI